MNIFNKYLEMSFKGRDIGLERRMSSVDLAHKIRKPVGGFVDEQDKMASRTIDKIIDQIANLQDYVGPGFDVLGEIVKRLGK